MQLIAAHTLAQQPTPLHPEVYGPPEQVQEHVQLAVALLGLKPDAFSSHSSRLSCLLVHSLVVIDSFSQCAFSSQHS